VTRLWVVPGILGMFTVASFYLFTHPPSAYYSTYSPYYGTLTFVFAVLTVAMVVAIAMWESAKEGP